MVSDVKEHLLSTARVKWTKKNAPENEGSMLLQNVGNCPVTLLHPKHYRILSVTVYMMQFVEMFEAPLSETFFLFTVYPLHMAECGLF